MRALPDNLDKIGTFTNSYKIHLSGFMLLSFPSGPVGRLIWKETKRKGMTNCSHLGSLPPLSPEIYFNLSKYRCMQIFWVHFWWFLFDHFHYKTFLHYMRYISIWGKSACMQIFWVLFLVIFFLLFSLQNLHALYEIYFNFREKVLACKWNFPFTLGGILYPLSLCLIELPLLHLFRFPQREQKKLNRIIWIGWIV